MIAACAQSDDDDNETADGGKKVTLKILCNLRSRSLKALDRLKKDYENENPGVKLQIETVGGGADYGAALKAKFASGDEPDIFNNGGIQLAQAVARQGGGFVGSALGQKR